MPSPAHPPEQNSAPSPRVAALARRLAALTEAELLAQVRGLSDPALRRLYDLVGVRSCDCPIETERCTCLRDRWAKQIASLTERQLLRILRGARPAGARLVGGILGYWADDDTPGTRAWYAAELATMDPRKIAANADALSNGELQKLCRLFGASSEPCSCPVIVRRCCHATAPPVFDWPPAVAAEVLRRLDPGQFHAPPEGAVGRASLVTHREALADVRRQRHAAGLSLWNPDDRVHAPVTGAREDRIVRRVTRRSNGSDAVGRVTTIRIAATQVATLSTADRAEVVTLAAADPPRPPGTGPEAALPPGNGAALEAIRAQHRASVARYAGDAGPGLTDPSQIRNARLRHAGQIDIVDPDQGPAAEPP